MYYLTSITLTLTYVAKVITLSDFQKVLVGARCSLKKLLTNKVNNINVYFIAK